MLNLFKSISLCLLFIATSVAEAKPLVVSIDSPEFRRLIAAVPTFKIDGGVDNATRLKADRGALELSRLLEYTGIFKVISEAAYDGEVKGKGGSDAKEIQLWKSIGAESLTKGKIFKEGSTLVLEIKTLDTLKSKVILSKRFTEIQNFTMVIRRYADLLYQAYTGKQGVFSTKIVMIGRATKKSNKQIYICDFDGTNLKQVTHDKTPHLSPNWSPDGKGIVFTSYAAGNPDLYVIDLKTMRKKKISAYQGINSGGAYSPNGKLLAFTGSVAGDSDIYITSPNGGNRKALIKGLGLDVDPTFSPDGKWLAFVSGRFGRPHIFRGALSWSQNMTKVKVLRDKRLTYAGWYNATPSWSPDSKKLSFAGYDKEIDRFDIFMMNHDGSQLERLTLRAGDNESPSWAPNGEMVAFQSNRMGTKDIKGRSQIYVMNRDGSGQRKLDLGLYDAETPTWSPVIR